jgi:hypothetical protein
MSLPVRKPRVEKEALTFSRFKDGFSLIPILYIAQMGEQYGLKSGQMFFRDYADHVAKKVWSDDRKLTYVLNNWHHCFPREYEIIKP